MYRYLGIYIEGFAKESMGRLKVEKLKLESDSNDESTNRNAYKAANKQ